LLEHAVQPQRHEIVGPLRDLVQTLGLRQGMSHTARAQHLEGVQHDRVAAQPRERRRVVGVESAPRASARQDSPLWT